MPQDEVPSITVDDLAVSFPAGKSQRMQAVDRVHMSIYPRQTLAVVGESGSGKSVTALSILRLIPTPPGRYDSGRILWRADEASSRPKTLEASPPADASMDLLHLPEKRLRSIRGNHIAMIFQEPMTSLNPVYTIGEQILEAVRLHQQVGRHKAVETAEQALHDVGIADPASRLGEYPHQLSGGMRQRVMIAMALACQPRLLLADEPTTALDVTIQAQILDLLKQLQTDRGMSIMLITHDLGVVAQNADVVAVMYAGRICEYANVDAVFSRPLHPYTRGLLKSMPVLGRPADRLPTVVDGADVPDDFPEGYSVAPHDPHPNQIVGGGGGYGGPDAHLHEVEPRHWVLCTPTPDNAEAKPTPPRLAYRRTLEPAPTAA